MIQCIIDKTIRLEKVTNNTFLTAPLVSGNSLAHMVRLRVLDSDGEPADLTGISATGAFNRPDGHQVTPINVTITGNVVECVFPASCYTTAGRFRFMLDLNETVNNETALRTAFVLDGLIEIGPTGSVVDPGTPVPNIQAAIANAQLATTAATTAAQTATTAAAAAQDVADNVEGEVSALKSATSNFGVAEKTVTGGASESWESADFILEHNIYYIAHIPSFTVRGSLTGGYVIAQVLAYVSAEDTTGLIIYQITKTNYDGNAIDVVLDNRNGTFYKVTLRIRSQQNTVTTLSVYPDAGRIIDDVSNVSYYVGDPQYALEFGDQHLSEGNLVYLNKTTRVRFAQNTFLHLNPGSVIGLKSYTGYTYYVYYKKDSDGTYASQGWLTKDFIVAEAGNYTVLMRNAPETETSVSVFENLLFIIPANSLTERINSFNDFYRTGYNLIDLNNIKNGYFETNGTVITPGSNGEKYCDTFIPVTPGEVLTFLCTSKVNGTSWYRAITYGVDQTRIGNISASKTQYAFEFYFEKHGYNTFSITVPSNVYFIKISWRAYGNEFAVLIRNTRTTVSELEGLRESLGDAVSYCGNSHVKGINHAGYTLIAPENTLPAYVESRKHGFKFVECDIQFTSDGVPVLLHDDTINRTARNTDGTEISGTVYISSITFEEAQSYDFGIYKGSAYAGTKIPSLEQFILLCKRLGLHPYIEIKAGASQAQVESCVNCVKKAGMLHNVTWISFSDTILSYVNDADAKARIGYIVSVITVAAIGTATALKTTFNDVFINAAYSTATDSNVDLCISANLPLEIWTLNDLANVLTLNPYVSGITSDRFNADAVFYGLGLST